MKTLLSLLALLLLVKLTLADDDLLCRKTGIEVLEHKTCNDIVNQFADKSASCCWYKAVAKEATIYGCQRLTSLSYYKQFKSGLEKEAEATVELFCNSGIDEDYMCDKEAAPIAIEQKTCNDITDKFKDKTGYKCCWVKTTKDADAYDCRRVKNTEEEIKAIVTAAKNNDAKIDIQCDAGYLISSIIMIVLSLFLF